MSTHNGRQMPIPLPRQYSAEIIRSDNEAAKVYVDGARRRTETCVGGVATIAITRPELGLSYMVFPDSRSYFVSPLTDEMIRSLETESVVEEWELVREEELGQMHVAVFNVFNMGAINL